MNDAVANGVCKSGVPYLAVPFRHVKLGTEYRGTLMLPSLDNFQNIPSLALFGGIQQPFIQNKKPDLFVLFDNFLVRTIGAGNGQFPQQIRKPSIFNRIEIAGCSHTQSTAEIRFANAGSTQDDDIMAFLDIGAGSQPGYLGFIQFPVCMVRNVL